MVSKILQNATRKPKTKAKTKPKEKTTYKSRDWTAAHTKKMTWLYNYMYENYVNDDGSYMEKDTFIIKNKRSIISIVENNEGWADGSKENILYTVARFLWNKGYKKDAEKYADWANVYREKIANVTDNNELDENIKVTFYDLDKEEKISWREHSYFMEILNNIDEKQIANKAEHYKYLLLNLLVKHPPIRTTFYTTAQFITSEKDNNKKDNFIYFNRR